MQASPEAAPIPHQIVLVGPVPPPNGGMALQMAQLQRLLEQSGAQTELLPTNAAYRPSWIGAVPVVRAFFRLVQFMVNVWRIAGRGDLIHLMANSGWSWHLFATPVLLIAPLRATPVVVNYRGGEARAFFENSFRWVRPALQRASAIVVPSGYLHQVFRDFGIDTTIVPNVLDRSMFNTAGAGHRSPSPFRFVITRNLERIYGIETALHAFSRLVHQSDVQAVLEIAGTGPEESSLRQLATDLNIAEQVHFLGRLEREDIVTLYRRAHAMLNPTTVDNMPNSVLEALACGVPVISSNVGGVPFITKDEKTALLVPVGDEVAFADAMSRLIMEPALARSLAREGEASVEQYDWGSVCDQWASVYQRVITS